MNNKGYVTRTITNYDNGIRVSGTTIKMHREVMKVTDPKILVDHKFHDKLDNQKSKLRICTNQENCMNRKSKINSSSKYKGVHFSKKEKKWVSQIEINGKNLRIGCFKIEEDAALAYNKKARELFGEFAILNELH